MSRRCQDGEPIDERPAVVIQEIRAFFEIPVDAWPGMPGHYIGLDRDEYRDGGRDHSHDVAGGDP